jgi:hypothetical protein
MMTRQTIIILLIYLISFLNLNGQVAVIEGEITSNITGLPTVEQGQIMIDETKHFQIADSTGRFKFEGLYLDTEYTIRVFVMGYDNYEKKVSLDDSINHLDITLHADCDFNKEKANSDINNNEIKLLLFGSIAPIANSTFDNKIERKYNFKYYDFGCSPPAFDCIKEYNLTIFKYLDNTYGKGWRNDVRQDVEFFKLN